MKINDKKIEIKAESGNPIEIRVDGSLIDPSKTVEFLEALGVRAIPGEFSGIRSDIKEFAIEVEKRMASKDKIYIDSNDYRIMPRKRMQNILEAQVETLKEVLKSGSRRLKFKELVDTAAECMMLHKRLGELK